MEKSRIMKSGFCSTASITASLPSAAWPQTIQSSRVERVAASFERTSSLSSAMSILTGEAGMGREGSAGNFWLVYIVHGICRRAVLKAILTTRCRLFCGRLSRSPAFRLQNSRETLRPEFMFGLAISAHGSSDQNVFLGVAPVANREDLSAFGIHNCQGASRFEMNGAFDFDHTQIVLPEKRLGRTFIPSGQQNRVKKRHQIYSDCVRARKVCKTEQTQKIARAISMRKPGHRWCRDRVRIHPSGSPPSID